MKIFNSLGSNYNLRFILKSLFGQGDQKDLKALKSKIDEKYSGQATLFYKGREALTFGLESLDLSHDAKVAINGFTCVAVFNGIRKAGFEPYCVDLEESGGLNFTAKSLSESVKKDKKIKAVIVQNTLGYPCDIAKIESVCRDNNLILIEDLAHCVGTIYSDGREAGTVGDLITLSFSQDKIIDAISGGALVIRNEKIKANDTILNSSKNLSQNIARKDRLYPLIAFKIRFLYGINLGKIYHFFVKKLGFMTKIMDESFYTYFKLPPFYAMLALNMFAGLDKQLAHRKEIAEIYTNELPDRIFMYDREKTAKMVSLSTNLRFPIFIENRKSLIKKLKENGIFVSDIWYSDVAPDCPNAIRDSQIILNLPTHININKKKAEQISVIINQWLQ